MADKIPQQGSVFNLPVPPSMKSTDFLKAYSGWVYSAVNHIAQSTSTSEIKLFKRRTIGRGDSAKVEIIEVKEHEVLSLLATVNEFMTFTQLRHVTEVYMQLLGEAVWALLRNGGGEILEIWPLRPDWVEVNPSSDFIKSYTYKPGGYATGVEIDANDIIFFKDFDPQNPYRGYGKVKPAALDIDTDDFSTRWNRNFFFNSAMPSSIITVEGKMNEASQRKFLEKFYQGHGGVMNAHKVALIAGSKAKVEKLSENQSDMDFLKSKTYLRDKILSMFNLSKTDIGLFEDVNRASSVTADRRYFAQVVKPRLINFVSFLNEFLIGKNYNDEGLFFNITNPVPGEQSEKLERYTNGLTNGWLTINEVREEEGLMPVENGDFIYLGSNVFPIGGVDTPPPAFGDSPDQNDNEDQNTDNEDEDNVQEEGLMNTIRRMFKKGRPSSQKITRLKAKRKQYKTYTERDFIAPIPPMNLNQYRKKKLKSEIKHDLVRMIHKLMTGDRQSKKDKSVMYTDVTKEIHLKQFIKRSDGLTDRLSEMIGTLGREQRDIVLDKLRSIHNFDTARLSPSRVMFSISDEQKKWEKLLRPFIFQLIQEESTNVLLSFFGIKKQNEPIHQLINNYLESTGIRFIDEMNETTDKQLRETILEGIRNGEGIELIADRIDKVYDGLIRRRSIAAARTNVISSLNFGADIAYRTSGLVDGKEWLAAEDRRTRPTHADASGQVVSINKKFEVGRDKLEFPGDPRGSAEEIVNCRCTIVPVVNLGRLQNTQFIKEKGIDVDLILKNVKEGLMIEQKKQEVKRLEDVHELIKKDVKDEYARLRKDSEELKRLTEHDIAQTNKDWEKVLKRMKKEYAELSRLSDLGVSKDIEQGEVEVKDKMDKLAKQIKELEGDRQEYEAIAKNIRSAEERDNKLEQNRARKGVEQTKDILSHNLQKDKEELVSKQSELTNKGLKKIRDEKKVAKRILDIESESITRGAKANAKLARRQARSIVSDAKEKAKWIVKSAESEGEALKEKILKNLRGLRQKVKDAIGNDK